MEHRLEKLENICSRAPKTLEEIVTTFETYDQIIREKDEEIKDLKVKLEQLSQRLEIQDLPPGPDPVNSDPETDSKSEADSISGASSDSLSNSSTNDKSGFDFDGGSDGYDCDADQFVNGLCERGNTEKIREILPKLIATMYPINDCQLVINGGCCGDWLGRKPANPLSHALLNGHYDLARLLVDNAKDLGLDLNHIYEEKSMVDESDPYEDHKYGTILHLAVRKENVAAVKFLLTTDVNVDLDVRGRKVINIDFTTDSANSNSKPWYQNESDSDSFSDFKP